MSRVLVTGATGFVGRALCRELRGSEHAVCAPVRATSRTAPLDALGVEHAVVPLQDHAALTAYMDACDVVVHAAGGGMTVRPEEMAERNLTTTEQVLQAALDAGVARMVLVSSMAAGGARAARDAPCPEKALSLYGQAKADAEALLLAQADRIEVVILRPPGVTGAGDDRMLPMFRAARRGLVPVPRCARTNSFVHVDDCARALALLAEAPLDGPVTYGINDGAVHDWDHIVDVLGQAVGRSARLVRVPMALLKTVGAVSELGSRIRNTPTVVHRDKVRDMHGVHWVSDASRLQADTGWAPQMSLLASMTEMARDYEARGLL